ncbi:MAG: hypothetical protein R3291_05675, partial [Thermoplasmata archaeon]|nr:hypothetical protein [Thermoplasmata archaeon]
MRSGAHLLPLLSVVLIVFVGVSPALGQDYPTYHLGDRWDYGVVARLDSLLGLENVTGEIQAEGDARAEVTALEG